MGIFDDNPELFEAQRRLLERRKQLGLAEQAGKSLPTPIELPRKLQLHLKLSESIAQEALAAEQYEALQHGKLHFLARCMTQTNLPHKKPISQSWNRENGFLRFSITADSVFGLPYGIYPRLLLIWVTTEAVRTKNPKLMLRDSLSAFMREVKVELTGGVHGTAKGFRKQVLALFNSTFSINYTDATAEQICDVGGGARFSSKYNLSWRVNHESNLELLPSFVILSEDMFKEITTGAMPLYLWAIRALKRNTLAVDVYTWLNHRYSYLRGRSKPIPWEALALQFGASYKEVRQFKYEMTRVGGVLMRVRAVYKQARFEPTDAGLVLFESPTHVPKLPQLTQ